jgi:hypothetical protein
LDSREFPLPVSLPEYLYPKYKYKYLARYLARWYFPEYFQLIPSFAVQAAFAAYSVPAQSDKFYDLAGSLGFLSTTLVSLVCSLWDFLARDTNAVDVPGDYLSILYAVRTTDPILFSLDGEPSS